MDNNDKARPLIEHILEFRSVILQSFLCIIICMIISFIFIDHIFNFIIAPLKHILKNETKIVYTSIMEPITTEFRLSFYSAIIISFPLILRNIWKFIKTGLYENEKQSIKNGAIGSFTLFVIGLAFAYYIVMPSIFMAICNMAPLGGVDSNVTTFLPKMSDNVSFIIMMMLSFGISFQIPLVMIFLNKLKILSFKKQQKIWREYTTCIVIISAIITPPDALSMIFLAVPLILLYFLTLFIFGNRKIL